MHRGASARLRATSNPRVSVETYKEAITRWLQCSPHRSLRQALGGVLVRSFRHVTPAMVRCCSELISDLVSQGCESGVLSALKFESALSQVLASSMRGDLLGTDKIDKIVLEAGFHLQAIFSMLRYMKAENSPSDGPRRFARTGGFRKQMSADDWVHMSMILAHLQGSAVSEVGASEDGVALDEEDDDEWPAVSMPSFRRPPRNTSPSPTIFYTELEPIEFAEPKATSRTTEPTSTIENAEPHGRPPSRTAEPHTTSRTGKPQSITEQEEPLPIMPKPRKRKQLALDGRKKEWHEFLS